MTILLIGAYGQGNTGDELLLEICLHHLTHTPCCVTSLHPRATADDFGARAVSSQGPLWQRAAAFFRARAVVVGGGSQLKRLKPSFGRPARALLWQFAALTLAARLLRKPVLYLAIGLDPLPDPLSRCLASIALRLAAAVTVRDRASLALARRLAPRANVRLAADLLWLRPAVHADPAPLAPLHLAVAPARHLDRPDCPVADTLARAIRQILQDDPLATCSLLAMQHGPCAPGDGDLPLCRDIVARVDLPARCRVTPVTRHSIDAALAPVTVLWGARLHALLLAAQRRIPFLALVYDPKITQFLDHLPPPPRSSRRQEAHFSKSAVTVHEPASPTSGSESSHPWAIPLDPTFTPDALLAAHQRLVAARQTVRAQLADAGRAMEARAALNAEAIEALLQPLIPSSSRCAPFDPSDPSDPSELPQQIPTAGRCACNPLSQRQPP